MQQSASGSAPLIVTASLPADMQAWADRLRTEHFPPERNFLRAHVTLFHALPGMVLDEARSVLADMCRSTPPVRARLCAIMDLGNGTAFRIESEEMLALRRELADRFHGLLTGQDSHVPRLHVTIQNKVVRAQAIALQNALRPDFAERDFTFAGLALHHYLNGPWQSAGAWSFRGTGRDR